MVPVLDDEPEVDDRVMAVFDRDGDSLWNYRGAAQVPETKRRQTIYLCTYSLGLGRMWRTQCSSGNACQQNLMLRKALCRRKVFERHQQGITRGVCQTHGT